HQPGDQVRDDVPVQVLAQQHVEPMRIDDELHAHVVDDLVVATRSGYSAPTSWQHFRNSPSESFMMFALCTVVTRLRPCLRACSKAKRAMRVEATALMILRLSITPGTTSCSMPL